MALSCPNAQLRIQKPPFAVFAIFAKPVIFPSAFAEIVDEANAKPGFDAQRPEFAGGDQCKIMAAPVQVCRQFPVLCKWPVVSFFCGLKQPFNRAQVAVCFCIAGNAKVQRSCCCMMYQEILQTVGKLAGICGKITKTVR